MRSLVVVLLALGCQQQNRSAPPPAPVPSVTIDAGAGTMPIEKVWGLIPKPYPKAKRDCALSSVVRRRFAGTVVKPCGVFPLRENPDPKAEQRDDDAARTCVTAAIAANQPFEVEKEVRGIDSGVEHALMGVLEKGKLVLYWFTYDSNPCGGGCPERGHTMVDRCESFELSASPCSSASLFSCSACLGATPVENCVFGPIEYTCVADEAAETACMAKGPLYEYGPPRGSCPGKVKGAKLAAETKRLLASPCACLDVAAEKHWYEQCQDAP